MQVMNYVEVLVGDSTYHGAEALTYQSESDLKVGQIVQVPIRKKIVLGIVKEKVNKPSFKVKSVAKIPLLVNTLPLELIRLHDWVAQYYPAPQGVISQLFLPKTLPDKYIPLLPRAKAKEKNADITKLTVDQTEALERINESGPYILHGETGTGKTRIYIELTRKTLEEKRSVIILTPEIGLTPQLTKDFEKEFGDSVIVVHSGITDSRRSAIWRYIIEAKRPLIIIGARSALFSPLKKIGLIVVDESHETAYKQDQAPRYHANMVAAKLAQLHNAILILGSATPSIVDYLIAEARQRPIIRMTQIATKTEGQTITEIINLRNKELFSKSPYLSDRLILGVKTALAKDEQILLFLNRRGTARVVFCDRCGWQALCDNCDLPMVYHGDMHIMRCHSCGSRAPCPASCPSCHKVSIVFKSIGTKALDDEAKRLFPGANIMRFDTDNKKDERIEAHYESLHAGKVDILIGTQTLAKGLDLPKLSLVGVVMADTSLYFPDFSAQERTYQLLRQVLGRVGRGHREGRAIVQTYNPDSIPISAALNKDWTTFYNNELQERKKYIFPPYCYLLKLSCQRATSASAQRSAQMFSQLLNEQFDGILVEGPAPSFHEKSQKKFTWQIIIKAKVRSKLIEIIKILPANWSYDIDPMNLL